MRLDTVASAIAKYLMACSCECLGSRVLKVSPRVAAYDTSGFKRAAILAGDGQWIIFTNFPSACGHATLWTRCPEVAVGNEILVQAFANELMIHRIKNYRAVSMTKSDACRQPLSILLFDEPWL